MMQIEELYQIYLRHPSVKTDTRTLQNGDIYFALKGPNFNGNTFALQALKQGAAYAIVDEYTGDKNDNIIIVDDVLNTLQQLAGHHRNQFNIPIIAITGSNGKTTTKELVHAVLKGSFKTYTTEGNLNNHIGIPLTLLKIKADAEIAIVEMGANHLKEIEGYCKYTRPTHGLITNCGKAHLEGFGGVDGVRKGKGELYDYLNIHDGTAFVMWDYDYLRKMSEPIAHIITYGTENAWITGEVISHNPFVMVGIHENNYITEICSQLVGDYNLPNILAAVAVGRHFKVPYEKIKQQIEDYTPSNSRSQLLTFAHNKVVLDAYNANPSSMQLAIQNFAKLKGDKVLILGGMMELGKDSKVEHDALLTLVQQYNWQQVICIGGDFVEAPKNGFQYFNDTASALAWLKDNIQTNTTYLIKGSRGMQLEKLLPIFTS